MGDSVASAVLPAEPHPVGGPVSVAWREGTLTRARELEALSAWVQANHPREHSDDLVTAVACHLQAAREAAEAARPKNRLRMFRNGSLIERAMSNLDAAEALLLNFAPPDYVLGQLPCLLKHVRCHLVPSDPRRQAFERVARALRVADPDHPRAHDPEEQHQGDLQKVEEKRGRIVTAVRAASSAALREQMRVRSFRNVLLATIAAMTLLAIGIAWLGYRSPTLVPLCFAPQDGDETVVVCPTAHSRPLPAGTSSGVALDDAIDEAARPSDLFVVEVVGLMAAAVASAAAIGGIRGSSEALNLPVLLAVLKLPMGAITAFLGLLLMRGQFVPGLSALDTSAQILAWALVFGYAQQLFTRLVDQQGHSVLEGVRGADRPAPAHRPA